jgi:hypothetical protein
MRRNFRYLPAMLLLCAAVLSQAAAFGQQQVKIQKTPHPPGPYTAEFKTTRVQTLSNGTTISRETTTVEARDSQGRSLFSDTSTRNFDNQTITRTHIEDSIAGARIEWDSDKKKATVIKLPAQEQMHGCWAAQGGSFAIHYDGDHPLPPAEVIENRPKATHEDLGTATIQGVEAHGTRTTFLTPAGAAGNDQPLARVIEDWNAPSLHLQLRRIVDDPRTGKMDRELVNLTRGEPDAALFQIPEGYEVVNEDMVPCKE